MRALAVLVLLAAAARAQGPEDLGRALARAARGAGARVVSVAPVEAPVGADAETAVDPLVRGLVASGRVRVVERERLGAVLSERRLAEAGVVPDRPAALAAADAVVVARLERFARGWRLSARVVSSADGTILAGGESDAGAPPAAPPPVAEPDAFPALDALVDRAHARAVSEYPSALAADLSRTGAEPSERAAALLALSELEAVSDLSLGDALRDREPLVRLAAAMALGRTPAPWAEGPLRLLVRADPCWLARFGAAQALSRYPSRATAADLASARTADPSWRVRRQAADSLTEQAVPAR